MKYLCLIMLVALVSAAQAQNDVQLLSGFEVPEYDEQGNMKSMLTGDLAELTPDGMVNIKNFAIDFYKLGQVEMRVEAPQCTYDQRKKLAKSDDTIRISRDMMTVTGRGFEWSSAETRFHIENDARVEIKNVTGRLSTGEKE